MSKYINVHRIIEKSRVNGPGIRSVVWTQGCSLYCEGCFNKELQSFKVLKELDVNELAENLAKIDNDGLTFSGGEPLDQMDALLRFIYRYKEICNKTIFLFTGYSYEEIKQDETKKAILLSVDAALCGRYKRGEMWGGKELIIVSGRISAEEIKVNEQIEVVMNEDSAYLTGYPSTY